MGHKSIKPKCKPIEPIESIKSIKPKSNPKSKSIKPIKSEFNLGSQSSGEEWLPSDYEESDSD